MQDLGDEAEVSKRDVVLNARGHQELERFRTLLRSYEGREFIWNLLSFCKTLQPAPMDTETMARSEGKRDVGLYVHNKCFTSSPDAYNVMQQEADDRDLEMTNVGEELG